MNSTKDIQPKWLRFIHMWTILSGVTVLLCLICAFAIPFIQNSHHIFRDFLIGDVAYDGTNRLGEWHLFWGLLLAGCLLTFVLSLIEPVRTLQSDEKQRIKEKITARTKQNPRIKERLGYVLLCCIPMLAQLFIYGKTSGKILFLTAAAATVLWINGEKANSIIADFICIYFAIEVIAVVLAIAFQNYILGDDKLLLSAVILTCIWNGIVHFRKKQGSIAGKMRFAQADTKRFIMYVQLCIPFLFLAYLKDQYSLQGTIYTVPFSKRFVCVIIVLIAVLLTLAIWQIKRGKQSVLFSTVFSVCAFVSYMPPALIMQSDLHHHGEQILAWQQIVELGQKAYEEYSPASGFFPMIAGGINDVLFHGQATEYAAGFVLFALLFEALICFLLYRRLGGEWALFAVSLFHMPQYCRTWILLPVLLILSDSKLIKDKVRWFLFWIGCIFLAGLYYPLFGAALLLGTLPFGILMFLSFIKKKEWQEIQRKSKKQKNITLLVSICLLLNVLCGIPLLWRMLSHVLSMAGQTLDVDGKSIIGYAVPDWFMPYLAGWEKQTLLYYVVRFVFGIVFAMVSVYCLGRFQKCNQRERADVDENATENDGKNIVINKTDAGDKLCNGGFLLLSSIPIVLCFCYSYTMVCMDESWVGNILSRSDHVILFVSGLGGLVVLLECGSKFLTKAAKNFLIACALAIPFVFFYDCGDYAFPYLEGRTDDASAVVGEYADKLLPYQVKEGYVLITSELAETYPDVEFSRIGNGFIQQNVLANLEKNEVTYHFLKQYDPDIRLLGFEHTQFYYYLLNEKSVYSGRTAIAKSKAATEKVIKCVDEHTAVRGSLIPLEQYYLYRYFIKQGYVYLKDLNLYVPGALYQKIYGVEGTLADSTWTENYDCKMTAGAFAKSLTAMECFEKIPDIAWDTATHIVPANVAAQENTIVQTTAAIQEDKPEKTNARALSVMLTFPEPVDGTRAEFLHIKLGNSLAKNERQDLKEHTETVETKGKNFTNVKLTARFTTPQNATGYTSVTCDYADGDLLIPLGINAAWMTGQHSAVELIVENMSGDEAKDIQVETIEFYRLKE